MIKLSQKSFDEDEISVIINDSFLNSHKDIEKALVDYLNNDMYNKESKNSYEKFNEKYQKIFERYIDFCDAFGAWEFWTNTFNSFTNQESVYFRIEIV